MTNCASIPDEWNEQTFNDNHYLDSLLSWTFASGGQITRSEHMSETENAACYGYLVTDRQISTVETNCYFFFLTITARHFLGMDWISRQYSKATHAQPSRIRLWRKFTVRTVWKQKKRKSFSNFSSYWFVLKRKKMRQAKKAFPLVCSDAIEQSQLCDSIENDCSDWRRDRRKKQKRMQGIETPKEAKREARKWEKRNKEQCIYFKSTVS